MSERAKEIYALLLKIESRLSRMETKQDENCRNTSKIHKRIDRVEDAVRTLPCEAHVQATSDRLNEKVGLKHFIAIITVLFTLVGGAYTFTNSVDDHLHEHETTVSHYYQVNHSVAFDTKEDLTIP